MGGGIRGPCARDEAWESGSPWLKAAQGQQAVLAKLERTYWAKHVPEGRLGRCGFQVAPAPPPKMHRAAAAAVETRWVSQGACRWEGQGASD